MCMMYTSCALQVDTVNIMVAKKRAQPAVRSAYHHGSLRDALVEAGLRRLESGDRTELSLRDLARQVGVAPNAVYRHFADKEALVSALAAEGFRRLRAAQLDAAARNEHPGEVLLAAGRGYIEFARAHPALYSLMFGRFGAGEHGDEFAESSRASFDVLLAQVAAAHGLQAGDAAALPGAVFAWGLTHGLSQLAIDGQLDHLGHDPSQLVDAALRIAGGVRGDRSASPAKRPKRKSPH